MSSLNINGKRCAGVWPNQEISFTNASASGFLSLITIPGNLLVLIVVFRNPNGKLRTPFNWFILNLALADLLVGAFVEPLSILVHVKEGLHHPPKYEVYLRPIYFTSCTASVLSLGMLTIDRYIAITQPMKYRATLSNKRAAVSSVLIWIISVSLPFLQDKIGFLWYFFVFGNASVLVTFIVLVFAFVRVYLTLRAQIRELEAIQGGNENRAQSNVMRTEAIITKTFMYMLIAFMFCYTPSLIMIYLMNFCTICSCQAVHWFRDLSFIFIVLNSCVNPFLYAWRLPNFKEAVNVLCKRNPQVRQLTDLHRAQVLNTPRATTQQTPPTNSTQTSKENNNSTNTISSTENNVQLPPIADSCDGAHINEIIVGSKL